MICIRRGCRVRIGRFVFFTLVGSPLALTAAQALQVADDSTVGPTPVLWDRPPETPDDPPAPRSLVEGTVATSPATLVVRGAFRSIQVNVDALGRNIVDDAANEPSIAVDPVSPSRIVIGWRQFDSVSSNFRQAGRAYSQDAGETWTFPGVLDPGQFRSDPVLAADADGNFYYYSLSSVTSVELFKSSDGGVTWTGPVPGFGGDKEWMTIDRTAGVGRGHIYANWNVQFSCCGDTDFARSVDHGQSFQEPLTLPQPSMKWGTLDVGPDGTLYMAGSNLNQNGHVFAKSSDAKFAAAAPTFTARSIDFGGQTTGFGGFSVPNPDGILGQVWIATDHSDGPTRGNIYVLGSVDPPGSDPLDVHFIRSGDGGTTWSTPKRINDDSISTLAYQWSGTMSVAPNGRIDVVWNDTRSNSRVVNLSELYYSFSLDAGETWSPNVPVSPVFNSHIGFPNQNKIGDYYHMVSDNAGANLAYAATFNGEQDVYFLRIGDRDCNDNGFLDADDITENRSPDCNANGVPDECEANCNQNQSADLCDISGGSSPDCDDNSVPDECEANLDGDGAIDACDDDIDGDGVLNTDDACDFTPPGIPVTVRGRPIGDVNLDCVVNLPDLIRLVGPSSICLYGPDLLPSTTCTGSYDYDRDGDVDMIDVAGFQNAFGRE